MQHYSYLVLRRWGRVSNSTVQSPNLTLYSHLVVWSWEASFAELFARRLRGHDTQVEFEFCFQVLKENQRTRSDSRVNRSNSLRCLNFHAQQTKAAICGPTPPSLKLRPTQLNLLGCHLETWDYLQVWALNMDEQFEFSAERSAHFWFA